MKQQIIVIHGGETFNTYKEYLSSLKRLRIDFKRYQTERIGWKNTLGKKLGKRFEVISPDMPNKKNVKYLEWKIWFEKFIPYIKPNVILVGHSLGGLFLVKYLSENKFPKKISATILVAAPYDDRCSKYHSAGFILPKSLKKFQKQGGKVFIYQSKDDPFVPFSDFKKYQKNLKNSTCRVFTNKGHFNLESFPELVKDIKKL